GSAVRVAQLDPGAWPYRRLAADLHAHAEAELQLLRLPARAHLGRIAFGKQGVAPRVHHMPGNPIRFAHGGDADAHPSCRPLVARLLQAVLVVVADLLQLHPGGAGAWRGFQELQGPPARNAFADGGPRPSRIGPRQRGERPARRHHDLVASLDHAHGDQRLAAGEGEPARVEELQRIVRSGGAGEQIVLRRQRSGKERAAKEGEETSARRVHLRECVRSTYARKAARSRWVTGPGLPSPTLRNWSPDDSRKARLVTGMASRSVLVMKTSSAAARASGPCGSSRRMRPSSRAISMKRARVTPSSIPRASGGVTRTPCWTKNTLEVVPSVTRPRRSSRMASSAPASCASRSARMLLR